MKRSDVNSVTDNKEQEQVKGIAFVRSRRAKENVSVILSEMNLVTESHGVQIDYAYQDDSYSDDYDRRELDGFFEMLKKGAFCSLERPPEAEYLFFCPGYM